MTVKPTGDIVGIPSAGPNTLKMRKRAEEAPAAPVAGADSLAEAAAPAPRAVLPKPKREEVREAREPREPGTLMEVRDLRDLRELSNEDLFQLAEDAGVKDPANLRRHELMFKIVERQHHSTAGRGIEVRGEGLLDIVPDGFGFLRSQSNNYTGTPEDIYVSPSLIRRLGLRNGDMIKGIVRHPNKANATLRWWLLRACMTCRRNRRVTVGTSTS